MSAGEQRGDPWEASFHAITLFVDDVERSGDFYRRAFAVEPVHAEGDSVVFGVGGVLVNLLHERAVPELLDPAPMASAAAGARAVYTLEVPDVDEVVDRLAAAGIELLNGPIDRWWGPRTASFRDPFGHVWEIAGPVG